MGRRVFGNCRIQSQNEHKSNCKSDVFHSTANLNQCMYGLALSKDQLIGPFIIPERFNIKLYLNLSNKNYLSYWRMFHY